MNEVHLYVTLLHYNIYIYIFFSFLIMNHINFAKCDDISVILEFSVIQHL